MPVNLPAIFFVCFGVHTVEKGRCPGHGQKKQEGNRIAVQIY